MATLCVWPSLANAQRDPRQYVALDYQVDPRSSGCPNEEGFRARLSSQLGYDPHRPDAARKVEVITRPTAAGLEGVIRWTLRSDSADPRVFDAPTADCAQLIATMAFVLAVQIQLMGGGGESDADARREGAAPGDSTALGDAAAHGEQAAPPLPPSQHNGPRATPTSPARQSARPARDSDALVVSVGGGPSLGVGLAPEPLFQGRLFVGAQLHSVALELAVEAHPLQTSTFTRGTGFRHEMRVASLAACNQRGPLALCAATRVGLLEVTGVGVDRPLSASGLLVQIGPRVAYWVPLSKQFGLLGRVDGSYLLSPWVVRLDGAAIWAMPRFSTVAGIDLALQFH